jgi:putative phosphonate metabolism protein
MRVLGAAMEQMKRYAIYYAPETGAFAAAAASWLGWNLQSGQGVDQPIVQLPHPLAEVTAEPRKYGFHGTLKPPFRLAQDVRAADLAEATARLAASLKAIEFSGLQMVDLGGFLALMPQGDTNALQHLAAEVVRRLDLYRAALTDAEIARRKPERLTARQRDLLTAYGYPYVMEEFRFHLTLSGPLAGSEREIVTQAAAAHFSSVLPQPFCLRDLCLCGEDAAGHFHLLQRYPLMA